MCMQVTGAATREFSVLEHRSDTIDAWVSTLRTRFPGQPIAICLELHKGPIVSALRQYDFLVLFPINPLMLARYREAFAPSRAKDDPTDAELLLELLLKHRDRLNPFSPRVLPCAPSHNSWSIAAAWSETKYASPIASPVRSRTISHMCCNGSTTKIRPSSATSPMADPQGRTTGATLYPGTLLPRPSRALR